jgi:hypothetical protein
LTPRGCSCGGAARPDDQDDQDGQDEDELAELPVIDQETAEDPDALAALLDEVIGNNPAARRAQARIAQLHDQLQGHVAPVDFALVLGAEELSNARWTDLTLVLVRWAWAEGRRSALEEG